MSNYSVDIDRHTDIKQFDPSKHRLWVDDRGNVFFLHKGVQVGQVRWCMIDLSGEDSTYSGWHFSIDRATSCLEPLYGTVTLTEGE